MKVEQKGRSYIVEVRTEGHPVHDDEYVRSIRRQFSQFCKMGLGVGTRISLSTKLEAGSRQDGTPPEQLIMLPKFQVPGNKEGLANG